MSTPARVPFTLRDLQAECASEAGVHRLDDEGPRSLGLRIHVPPELRGRAPYTSTAYAFLQQLRGAIHEHGLVEFPGLPVNPTNHTLAQRAPWEHAYSQNPFLTGTGQLLHQDTPPYPTAFWLGAERRFFAPGQPRAQSNQMLQVYGALLREDLLRAMDRAGRYDDAIALWLTQAGRRGGHGRRRRRRRRGRRRRGSSARCGTSR